MPGQEPHSSVSAKWLDLSGVLLSAACVAHCLALPLAASLVPVAGAWAEAHWVHWGFVALAAPVSAYAFLQRPASPPSLLAVASLGVLLLVLGAAGWPEYSWERALTIIGGLLLAATHVWNGRRRAAALHRHDA